MKNIQFLFFALTIFILASCGQDLDSPSGAITSLRSPDCTGCIPENPSCGLDWSCAEWGNANCVIEIATEEVYQMILDIAGPGIGDPEIAIDIIFCDDVSNINGHNSPQTPPDHLSNIQLSINSIAATNYIPSFTMPCGMEIMINTTVTGFDNFLMECSDIVKCKAECCLDCQTCTPEKVLFTNFEMKYQEIKLIKDLKVKFCDGTNALDFGNAHVLAENKSGCEDDWAKHTALINWGIIGPYVTVGEYANYINEQLNLIPACEGASFNLYVDDFGQTTIDLNYEECEDCPIHSVGIKEWGYSFLSDECNSTTCMSYGYGEVWTIDCGNCYQ